MLEKVTQSICPMNEPRCPKCRRKAKAAINALMEPTDEMVEAGNNEGATPASKRILQAMLCEALKE